VIHITFPKSACEPCPARQSGTRSKEGVRGIGVRQQVQHEAIQQNRQAQTTPEFWKRYGNRSGIEGTLSQGVRAFDLRCSRYFGLAKTHLQHLAIATAINMQRIFDWLEEIPVELTRTSPFAQLTPDPELVSGHWRF
jgi:transposase